jgi:Na+-transporting methylmalonyl-CoA/oxaloacetate decarboxylase gamma subunit
MPTSPGAASAGSTNMVLSAHLMWDRALALVGAVAGIAALLYAVGVSTLWLRYEVAGYPAGAAIEHEPRIEMIALGIRGVGVVLALLALLVAASWLVALLLRWRARSRMPDPDTTYAYATYSDRLALARRQTLDRAVSIGRVAYASLFVIAVFHSWAHVAAVVVIAGAVEAMGHFTWQKGRPGIIALSPAGGALAISAVFLAAVMWQVSPVVSAQSVLISPALYTSGSQPDCDQPTDSDHVALTNIAIPYFGQDASYIYVDDVYCYSGTPNSYRFVRSKMVSRIALKGRDIVYPPGAVSLSVKPRPPAHWAWDHISRVLNRLGI